MLPNIRTSETTIFGASLKLEFNFFNDVLKESSINTTNGFIEYIELPIKMGLDKDFYTLNWDIDGILNDVKTLES